MDLDNTLKEIEKNFIDSEILKFTQSLEKVHKRSIFLHKVSHPEGYKPFVIFFDICFAILKNNKNDDEDKLKLFTLLEQTLQQFAATCSIDLSDSKSSCKNCSAIDMCKMFKGTNNEHIDKHPCPNFKNLKVDNE